MTLIPLVDELLLDNAAEREKLEVLRAALPVGGGPPPPPVSWIWAVGESTQANKVVVPGGGFWVLINAETGYRHEGWDLRTRPTGRPLLAVAPGVIARASIWDGTKVRWDAYGHHVVLCVDFTDYCVMYAHMKSVNVQTGQRVEQGQVVGFSGSSGNSSAEHCHLHVTHPTGRVGIFSQRVVDPDPLFPPAGQR